MRQKKRECKCKKKVQTYSKFRITEPAPNDLTAFSTAPNEVDRLIADPPIPTSWRWRILFYQNKKKKKKNQKKQT